MIASTFGGWICRAQSENDIITKLDEEKKDLKRDVFFYE